VAAPARREVLAGQPGKRYSPVPWPPSSPHRPRRRTPTRSRACASSYGPRGA
jgi:hypothetical protein